MIRTRFALMVLAVVAAPVVAAPPNPKETAAAVDKHLATGWEKAKVKPAAPADDAEFLRRVYLDLIGRIPHVTEARRFLDDRRPDKRARLVEELLEGRLDPKKQSRAMPAGYINHFSNVWRALLLPESNASFQARLQQPSFQAWLRSRLEKNIPYDEFVRELLTAPIAAPQRRAAVAFGDGDPSPSAFFFAKEFMPENLAAAASRVFLGVKLECAQCHDHPFATWKRDEFWSMAAFFAGMQRQGRGDILVPGRDDPSKREISIPNTNRTAKAKFLNGKEPEWKEGVGARETLAAWITQPDNPYFARATVNRLWAHFFGHGLIEPVDEIAGGDNASQFPEVLDALSTAFVAAKFDLKFLIKSIVLTRAYQLSSRGAAQDPEGLQTFARMPLRGLTPEQLFDSIATATGYGEENPNLPPGIVVAGRGGARDEFLTRFATTGDKPTDHQTSILQALALMNGRFVSDATAIDRSVRLSAVLTAPFLDTAGKIEVLYLSAYSRRPTAKESERIQAVIDERLRGADERERSRRYQESLADVFWALLNSSEFMLNH